MSLDQLTYQIIGCAMRVHNELGPGFQEIIYQRSLAIELEKEGLPFDREKEQTIFYKGLPVGTRRADFLVDEKIIVELKALSTIEDLHLVQPKTI